MDALQQTLRDCSLPFSWHRGVDVGGGGSQETDSAATIIGCRRRRRYVQDAITVQFDRLQLHAERTLMPCILKITITFSKRRGGGEVDAKVLAMDVSASMRCVVPPKLVLLEDTQKEQQQDGSRSMTTQPGRIEFMAGFEDRYRTATLLTKLAAYPHIAAAAVAARDDAVEDDDDSLLL